MLKGRVNVDELRARVDADGDGDVRKEIVVAELAPAGSRAGNQTA